jgi:cell division protein FtsA
MAKKDSLIVGLDIGTTKICAVVGEATPEGIDIVGIGTRIQLNGQWKRPS